MTFLHIFQTIFCFCSLMPCSGNNSVFRINIGFTFVFPDVIIRLRNRLRYQMMIYKITLIVNMKIFFGGQYENRPFTFRGSLLLGIPSI